MGYRHMTPAEFDYIKELISRHKDLDKVAEISGRSYSTALNVRKSKDFDQYLLVRPAGRKTRKPEHKAKAPTKKAGTSQTRKYDGAILAQLARTNRLLDRLNLNLEKMQHPKLLVHPSYRAAVPIEFELDVPEVSDEPKGVWGFFFAVLVILAIILFVIVYGPELVG